MRICLNPACVNHRNPPPRWLYKHGTFKGNHHLDRSREHAAKEGAPVVALCTKTEAELADLGDADKKEFLIDLGRDGRD